MSDFYDTITNYTESEKKERFLNSKGYLLLQERIYLINAQKDTLNVLSTGNQIEDVVSTTELKELYTNKFVGGNGRDFYDTIYYSTSICPSCLIRDIDQLDHFLAKSNYPLYSVSPYNLVPICGTCNRSKSAKVSATDYLHPYFSSIPECTWLKAKFKIHADNIFFTYKIDIPTTIENAEELTKKIELHMKNLELLQTFSSEIIQLHTSLHKHFSKNYISKGESFLLDIFQYEYEVALDNTPNNYLAAFYKCLIDDDYINNYLKSNLYQE